MNNSLSLERLFPIIQEQLDNGGSARFTIHGTSMLPMLKDGRHSVHLKKPSAPLKKYDIIFYRRDDGKFVLHRIVGIKKDGYVCRGDNQIDNEYPVKKEWVIGILVDYTEGGKCTSVNSFEHFIYSRFRVNTAFIRRAKHRIKKLITK